MTMTSNKVRIRNLSTGRTVTYKDKEMQQLEIFTGTLDCVGNSIYCHDVVQHSTAGWTGRIILEDGAFRIAVDDAEDDTKWILTDERAKMMEVLDYEV